jgi:hypothetical protein
MLRLRVRQSIAADIREGVDPNKADSRRWAKAKPLLRNLQERMEKLQVVGDPNDFLSLMKNLQDL